jgi:hypothetical protein
MSKSTIEAIISWEKLRKGETVRADEAMKIYDLFGSGTTVRRGCKTLLEKAPPERMLNLDDLKFGFGLQTDLIWHEAMDRMPPEEKSYILLALKNKEKLLTKPRVRLSTIHGAKGGEADQVVLITDMAWRTKKDGEQFPDDEARVWYVAATRARQQLTIVAPQTRHHYFL